MIQTKISMYTTKQQIMSTLWSNKPNNYPVYLSLKSHSYTYQIISYYFQSKIYYSVSEMKVTSILSTASNKSLVESQNKSQNKEKDQLKSPSPQGKNFSKYLQRPEQANVVFPNQSDSILGKYSRVDSHSLLHNQKATSLKFIEEPVKPLIKTQPKPNKKQIDVKISSPLLNPQQHLLSDEKYNEKNVETLKKIRAILREETLSKLALFKIVKTQDITVKGQPQNEEKASLLSQKEKEIISTKIRECQELRSKNTELTILLEQANQQLHKTTKEKELLQSIHAQERERMEQQNHKLTDQNKLQSLEIKKAYDLKEQMQSGFQILRLTILELKATAQVSQLKSGHFSKGIPSQFDSQSEIMIKYPHSSLQSLKEQAHSILNQKNSRNLKIMSKNSQNEQADELIKAEPYQQIKINQELFKMIKVKDPSRNIFQQQKRRAQQLKNNKNKLSQRQFKKVYQLSLSNSNEKSSSQESVEQLLSQLYSEADKFSSLKKQYDQLVEQYKSLEEDNKLLKQSEVILQIRLKKAEQKISQRDKKKQQ